jgi:ankyrin repeat protein
MCKGNALLYVIMLAERGIDVNLKNSEGDTALNLCAKNGAKDNIRIIQKLLEFKADPSISNHQGQSFYEILGQESERNTEYSDKLSDDEEEVEETENNKNNQQVLIQSGKINKTNRENSDGASKSLLKINLQLVIYVILPIFILIASKFFEEGKHK